MTSQLEETLKRFEQLHAIDRVEMLQRAERARVVYRDEEREALGLTMKCFLLGRFDLVKTHLLTAIEWHYMGTLVSDFVENIQRFRDERQAYRAYMHTETANQEAENYARARLSSLFEQYERGSSVEEKRVGLHQCDCNCEPCLVSRRDRPTGSFIDYAKLLHEAAKHVPVRDEPLDGDICMCIGGKQKWVRPMDLRDMAAQIRAEPVTQVDLLKNTNVHGVQHGWSSEFHFSEDEQTAARARVQKLEEELCQAADPGCPMCKATGQIQTSRGLRMCGCGKLAGLLGSELATED
jgi:hypothetical protein